MNNEIFNIDFRTLGRWTVPVRKRKPALLAFVYVLAMPFEFIYNDFIRYRKQKLYEIGITPARVHLERLLNDRYDYGYRRIYIKNSVSKKPLYIYKRVEAKLQFIYKRGESDAKIIYTRGESGDLKDNFTVFVPMDIVFEIKEMASLVRDFALPGMKYKIQMYLYE